MKKISIIITIVTMVIGLSSCRLFRKKNKCNTCPTWKAELPKKTNSEQQV